MNALCCGAETLATATAVAVELSHRLTVEQMNNLGNLLNIIGDELILLAGYCTAASAENKQCGGWGN